MDQPQRANPFTFHTRIPFESNGEQSIGDCPFCGKEKHFYHNNTTYQWDCKVCKKTGNLYQFIHIWHTHCQANGPQIEQIAAMRGINLHHFTDNRIRWNANNNSWVIPTYNNKGTMNNLYKVFWYQDKLNIIATPSLEQALFNWPSQPKEEIWIQEGHWDKMAGEQIVGPQPIDNVGVPGSGFKQSWTNLLQGKRVLLFGDNDDAGEKQIELILKRIEQSPVKPKELMRCRWPKDYKKGYDTNDCLREHGVNAYQFIREHTEPITTSIKIQESDIVADPSCDTFEKLLEECEKAYYFTDDMELLLLFLITTLYSLKIEGEQIWGRIIGPPGSSKTTEAKIIGSSEQTVMRSTFTGLLSGWKDEEAGDASLIPLIAGKALIVKDADALLKQPNVSQIFSELRDFYDKDTSVTYRNRISLEYKNVRSVFLLLGTHVLRGIDNAALGDRFLDFELRVTEEDRDAISQAMLVRSILVGETGSSPENNVWAKAKGLIDLHLMPMEGVAKLTVQDQLAVVEFCKLIAFMRAPVQRNKLGEIAYTPHAEVPSRLVGQFTKLLQCAPRILKLFEPNTMVRRLFHRLVIDVMDRESPRFKCAIWLTRLNSVSRDDLVKATGLPANVVTRELEDMIALKMVDLQPVQIGTHTQINHVKLTDKIGRQMKMLMEYEQHGEI